MDFAAVQYYLNDLPATFKRPGTTFQWWYNSLGYGVSTGTNAMDGVLSQAMFTNAKWEWLNLWGSIFGIPRPTGQTDAQYRVTIQFNLTVRGGTPVSIQNTVKQVYGLDSQVKENFGSSSAPNAIGWNLYLSSALPGGNYNALAAALGRVRPAGVPFSPFYSATGGLYASTVNFLGKTRVPGSWLNTAYLTQTFTIPTGTPNSVSQVPTVYLTDPTLNPNLANAAVQPPLAILSTPNSTPPGQLVLGTDAYTNFTIVSTDPNGTLGGADGDKAFNTANRVLYICTTAGTAATAVWTPVNEAVGVFNAN